MVSAIQITEGDFRLANVDPADRAIVQHEPGLESLRSMQPGKIQNNTHQMDEESAMADEGDALFRLVIFIRVAG